MNQPFKQHRAQGLTSYFWSRESIRSRSVSEIVLTGTIDIPVLNARLLADWERETSVHMTLDPGDVEEMPLARARARWPEYRQCMQVLEEWTGGFGLHEVLKSSDQALMACRGATYHHDGMQYGGAAFCNVFLSEDKGLDLLFPAVGCRIPLTRGTAVIFDTCQPHGVVQRGGSRFNADDFPAERDCTQIFLTWELPIEDHHVAHELAVTFDTDAPGALLLDEEQVQLNGERVVVCQDSGRWRQDG